MKKVFLFSFLILILFTGITNAQNKRVSWGMKAGFSKNFFTGNLNWHRQRSESFQFGILSEVKISKPISLRMELLYSVKGESTDLVMFDQNMQVMQDKSGFERIDLSYLELPVNAKFSIGKKVKPYCMLGIAPAMLLRGSIGLSPLPYSQGTVSWVADYPAKKMDVGILNSIGIEVNASKIIPFAELRMNSGIVKIDQFGTRNNQIILSAGIRF